MQKHVKSKYADKWKIAMEKEIESLRLKGVIEPVNETMLKDSHTRPITTRWVYAVKGDEHGHAMRFKARLVARGFMQQPGIDYTETFAPVARMGSFRLLLAISAQLNLHIWQGDIDTAYLNADIDEELFIKHIDGYKGHVKKPFKIKKALYGLKQSGRNWNNMLNNFLIEKGYKRCKTEPCLYYDTQSSEM